MGGMICPPPLIELFSFNVCAKNIEGAIAPLAPGGAPVPTALIPFWDLVFNEKFSGRFVWPLFIRDI